MQHKTAKDLMIPLSDYATVAPEATLHDAILALEESQKNLGGRRFPHMAVLVLDASGQVVGKIDQRDALKGLEPRYLDANNYTAMHEWGFSDHFIRDMIDQSGLFEAPLDRLCAKAAEVKAKDIMHVPTEEEQIGADATLDLAIHKFVMTVFPALLVTADREVIGILRRSDVFIEICAAIKTCRL